MGSNGGNDWSRLGSQVNPFRSLIVSVSAIEWVEEFSKLSEAMVNFIFAHDSELMSSSNEAFTDHPARFSFTFKLRGFLLWEAGGCLTSINMVRMWIPGSSWDLDSPESLIKSHAYDLYNQKVLTMFEKQLDGQMAQEKRDNGYLSVKARWRFVFLNLDLLYDKHPSTDTPW